MTKAFHIGAVLSITGDRLVAPNGFEDIYAILNYLTNSQLWTHQLPAAARKAKPWVLQQHPRLANADMAGVTPENWRRWLAEQAARYGEMLTLEQMPVDDQLTTDPFRDIPTDKPVIALVVEQEGQQP